MLLCQEPFQVLQRMTVARSKIGAIGGIVKQLPAEPLQQLLCAQCCMRERVVAEKCSSDCHQFEHLKRFLARQRFPGDDDGCLHSPVADPEKLVPRYDTWLDSGGFKVGR
ncbi:hypothetical protein AVEN_5482-1 [Araneus ventricosus]|uniref:Uncharacterized protein n=1 Tax=Araneus ventricosus TaxID=182803 RepID=A0A4Y2MWG4_ARAVE|nr:hypothetical protein AVEN_5482-1 [Araneus ventricosus]